MKRLKDGGSQTESPPDGELCEGVKVVGGTIVIDERYWHFRRTHVQETTFEDGATDSYPSKIEWTIEPRKFYVGCVSSGGIEPDDQLREAARTGKLP